MSNILFGEGKLNIGQKLINLASGGDTLKASLLTMTTATAGTAQITNAANATPIVVTTAAPHGISTGDIFVVGGVTGNLAANGTWKAGTVGGGGTTVQLLTRLDGVNSTGSGAYVSGGWTVDITTAATIADLGGNGGANGNGTDVTIPGQTLAVFGTFNATTWNWTGLSATKSWAIALYSSTAANDLIAWIDGTFQVYVCATAAGGATSIIIERLPVQIQNGTTIVFSNGQSATLTAQANVGDTSLAVGALGGSVTRQATADVITFNSVLGITSGLPVTPAPGGGLTFTPDTGVNKIFQL